MKLLVGDLDRDFEHPPKTGALIALREPGDRQVPHALGTISIETISLIRPLVPKIRRRDRSLAGQLVRAASSAAMNIAEADRSEPTTKKARFGAAAGDVTEVQAALRVAVAWGYLDATDTEAPTALISRMNAMLARLTRS
jgi:four helix bundle protein